MKIPMTGPGSIRRRYLCRLNVGGEKHIFLQLPDKASVGQTGIIFRARRLRQIEF